METYTVTRDVDTTECPWLPHPIERGATVHRFYGPTYGATANVPLTMSADGQTGPFFELPADAFGPMAYRASIGAILSVMTGRVVCEVDEMLALHDFLAGRSLMTHEYATPGMAEAHRATLAAQFPALADVTFPTLPEAATRDEVQAHCEAWVADIANLVGRTEADVTRDPETGGVDPASALNHVLDLMSRGLAKRDRKAMRIPEGTPLPWEGHDDPEGTMFIAEVESSDDDIPSGRFGPFPTRREAWLALARYVRNGSSQVVPVAPVATMVRP